MLFVCVSRRVFIVPRLNPEHPTRLRTCHHGKVSKHASRVIPVLFVEIFTCKRGAKYEGLSLEASRTFRIPCFTPQGRTSQLIPVTRKLQQPPLWQTAALHTSLTAVPWNHCELICLWSRLMRLRSFIRVLKTKNFSKMCTVRPALLQTYTSTGSCSWCNSLSINLKYTMCKDEF